MKFLGKEIVSIIGFPIDLGAGRRGVDMGPSALRIAGLQSKLEKLGYTVKDSGDIKIEIMERQKIQNPKLKYLNEILKTSKILAAKVEKVLANGEFPLCLGGDHSMALGTIAGIAAADFEGGKGATTIPVIQNCEYKGTIIAGGSATLGSTVRSAGATNEITVMTTLDEEKGKSAGKSKETGAAGETILVRMNL